MGHCLPLRCWVPLSISKSSVYFPQQYVIFSLVGRPMKRISYFSVLFYLFTTIDRALFTSAQQEHTRRQFPPTETCGPLCLPLRTSANAPPQGRETNCFLLLTLASPWSGSSSPLHLIAKAPGSENTEQTTWASPPAPGIHTFLTPESAQYTVWYLLFLQSFYPQINLNIFSLSDEGKLMNPLRIFCKVRIYSQMKQKGTQHLSDAAIIWISLMFVITMSTCTAIASVLGVFMFGWINSMCWLPVVWGSSGYHMWTQPGVFASPGKVQVFAEHHLDAAWGWEAMASKNLQNHSEC